MVKNIRLGVKIVFFMGEKSYFTTIKCIIYDFIDKKRRIFASVKTNGRCETSFHHLLLIQIILENLI
jgi:hypothetical protein